MKEIETPASDQSGLPKPEQSSNPYIEEFSSKKFGTGTLEFMQFEKQLQQEHQGEPVEATNGKVEPPEEHSDPFSDPMLVPKHLIKSGQDSNADRGAGSYAQAYQ